MNRLPHRLALLPAGLAAAFLTTDVLAGRDEPDPAEVLRASTPIETACDRWNTAPVRELLDEAMHRFRDTPTGADAWLAPRLHATVRMTRREAAGAELWNFLALAVAPDYVRWRHQPYGPTGAVAAARYTGRHPTQTFARLWWAAELFRDGYDYAPAVIACGQQDMINTGLRLDAVRHGPTALAMVRVLKDLIDAGEPGLGRRVNALCGAVNAAGATLLYDVIAPDAAPDHHALARWIEDADGAPPAPWERLPDGPDDCTAPATRRASCEKLAPMFARFLARAPLREPVRPPFGGR
ncbi:DUF6339 family protein [Streptomyces sp. RerS4]|uniref:DUF6339 family protein n=1 Tax=Streptomyces sp. RerS4 TaxID=2942449 RepID=UPI00201CA16F|nr:DUF6339 family protein [Streptomyces sp. RerS4]UQX03992.1 DUF6339 family protein [Streptomyces sp. RerS4]